MTSKHIQAIKERLEKATPGPWEVVCGPCPVWTIENETHEISGGEASFLEEDAEFIAHSRTDIEKLIRVCEFVLDKADGDLKNEIEKLLE